MASQTLPGSGVLRGNGYYVPVGEGFRYDGVGNIFCSALRRHAITFRRAIKPAACWLVVCASRLGWATEPSARSGGDVATHTKASPAVAAVACYLTSSALGGSVCRFSRAPCSSPPHSQTHPRFSSRRWLDPLLFGSLAPRRLAAPLRLYVNSPLPGNHGLS